MSSLLDTNKNQIFPRRIKSFLAKVLTGAKDEKWSRIVMHQENQKLVESLNPSELKVLEISGCYWEKMGFKEYTSVNFPEYDICQTSLYKTFDLIIADQVFEHLLWPYRAGKNVHQMLDPGGYFLITVPFLVRVHNYPVDCTRWTETGLKYFLAECGFSLSKIQTSSWGNRACVEANFKQWTRYRSRLHSLENESDFPYHVWALARK